MNISLSAQDFASLSPLLILLGFGLINLLVESFSETIGKKLPFVLTLVGFLLAIGATLYAPISTNPLLTNWIRFDQIGKFFTLFFLFTGLFTTLLASSFFKEFKRSEGEFYFLMLSAVFGLVLIGLSADFLTLFLGVETLSISLYIWCGYMKNWKISQESSAKYFLMGAVATAFFLYGIALIYGAIGTTQFDALLTGYQAISNSGKHALFLTGVTFITLALAFEAALVPFQVWAPDVYAGASNPVTSFMAVGTKAGAFAAFIRVFTLALPGFNGLWNEGIALLAIPSLVYANFVAMQQTQLRRFFAYSGISHAGYLLIPLAVGSPEALSSLLFYLVVYGLATAGSFAVLAFLDKSNEGPMITDLFGLFKKSPLLAGLMTLCLLTLAGLPPTAGFFAKFYLFKVAFQAGYYWLVVVGLIMAIYSFYYYLRMVGVMFSAEPTEEKLAKSVWGAGLVGAISVGALLFLSIYPAPLLELISR